MATRKQPTRDGLFKRGSIWWCWVRGKRYSTRCRDRKAAAIVKAKLERAAVDPVYRASHEATIGGAVTGFLEHYQTRGRSAGSLNMYTTKAGHLVRIFGERATLANITALSVDAFVSRRLKEGAARSTISKELTTLRQVLKLAKRHGSFAGDIQAIMPLGFSAEYEPKRRALSWDELERLVPEVAKYSPRHAGMVVFFVATACRKSEAERARGEDIDWDAWTVRVRGQKTELSDDEVPVAFPFRGLFAAWVPRDVGELWGVWHNMTRDLAAACRRLGIERVTANDLRRSNATLLRRAGASVDVVARVLRHSDSRMVERVYGRISAGDAGRLLSTQLDVGASATVQIQHSEGTQSDETGCPGPGSNQRHEDFQSYPTLEDPAFPGAFLARIPGAGRWSAGDLAYAYSTVATAAEGERCARPQPGGGR